MRLVLIGAVIALIAVGCGGGDSPTQTVAQNGSSESEATAVPTQTVAQNGSSESEATAVPTSTAARDGSGGSGRVAEYVAAVKCGETIGEGDPETWGEAAQIWAKGLVVWENVTPPEELKDYHNKNLAVLKALYDFLRSQDANEPYDINVFSQWFESTAQVSDLVSDYAAAINALDDETKAQLADAGCF